MAVTGWMSPRNLDIRQFYRANFTLVGPSWIQNAFRELQQLARVWKAPAGTTYSAWFAVGGYAAGVPGTRSITLNSSRFQCATAPARAYRVEFKLGVNKGAFLSPPKRMYMDHTGFPAKAGPNRIYYWSWPWSPEFQDRVWCLHPVWLYRDLSFMAGRVGTSWTGQSFGMRYYYID